MSTGFKCVRTGIPGDFCDHGDELSDSATGNIFIMTCTH